MRDKQAVRQQMLARLKALAPAEKAQRDQQLTQAFLASPIYQNAQTLALFLAMPFEFDSWTLVDRALEDSKTVLVPKTGPQGQMAFLPYREAELVRTSFGVQEPARGEAVPKAQIDAILVPGLAWNAKGYRIGFGAGFYDRYLADFSGRTVSLVYGFQQTAFEADAHDIAVEEVISDSLF